MIITLNKEYIESALQYIRLCCPDKYQLYCDHNIIEVSGTYDTQGTLILICRSQIAVNDLTLVVSVPAGLRANELNAWLIKDHNRVTDY